MCSSWNTAPDVPCCSLLCHLVPIIIVEVGWKFMICDQNSSIIGYKLFGIISLELEEGLDLSLAILLRFILEFSFFIFIL